MFFPLRPPVCTGWHFQLKGSFSFLYFQYTAGFGLLLPGFLVRVCVRLLLPAVGSCLLTDSSSSTNVTIFYLVHTGRYECPLICCSLVSLPFSFTLVFFLFYSPFLFTQKVSQFEGEGGIFRLSSYVVARALIYFNLKDSFWERALLVTGLYFYFVNFIMF